MQTVINDKRGIDNTSVKHALCDAVIEAGSRAAEAIGVRLAGVDIITRNPGVPLVESGGVIVEVNTTPGYHFHYYKGDGEFPVAVHVLEALLNS